MNKWDRDFCHLWSFSKISSKVGHECVMRIWSCQSQTVLELQYFNMIHFFIMGIWRLVICLKISFLDYFHSNIEKKKIWNFLPLPLPLLLPFLHNLAMKNAAKNWTNVNPAVAPAHPAGRDATKITTNALTDVNFCAIYKILYRNKIDFSLAFE